MSKRASLVVVLASMLVSCGSQGVPTVPDTYACDDERDPVERAACAARRELARARAENDTVKVLCASDKAAQIDAIRKSRIERHGEPRMIELLEKKADRLLYEVEHCVCVDPMDPSTPYDGGVSSNLPSGSSSRGFLVPPTDGTFAMSAGSMK